MGERRAGRGTAFQWLAGCAGLALGAAPLCAQTPAPADPAELDPSAPLDPMPDLGVEWPDLNQPEPAPPPEIEGVAPEAAAEATEEAAERVEDASRDARRYRWTISGIEALGRRRSDSRRIRRAIGARRRIASKTANAAQIDRRARADAELLAELLRSQGYYDATGRADGSTRPGRELAVELTATPGPLYRFESVELPGLEEAAGDEAAASARGVRGQGRRSGRRAKGDRCRRRAAGRARRARLRHRQGRRAGHRRRP